MTKETPVEYFQKAKELFEFEDKRILMAQSEAEKKLHELFVELESTKDTKEKETIAEKIATFAFSVRYQ